MRAPRPHLACGAVLAIVALTGCDARTSSDASPLRVRSTMGSTGLSPGQLVYPRAIDAGPDGVWVIDKTARVQRYDPETGRPTASFPMPESSLGKPTGVTIAPGPDGREAIYVPDTHYHRVLIFDADVELGDSPTLLGSFGSFGDGDGEFVYPTDVAVLTGSDGRPERIYVSEYGGNDRISVFDADHRFLFAFGRQGSGSGVEFDRPQSIGIDPDLGELIVNDACNHRVGRFTLDGEIVQWFGSPDRAGEEVDAFAYPYGLALPGNGTAVISEYGNGRVKHLDLRTGETLGIYGRYGRGEGELANPWGVVIQGEIIYVLDSGGDKVVSFRAPRRAEEAG